MKHLDLNHEEHRVLEDLVGKLLTEDATDFACPNCFQAFGMQTISRRDAMDLSRRDVRALSRVFDQLLKTDGENYLDLFEELREWSRETYKPQPSAADALRELDASIDALPIDADASADGDCGALLLLVILVARGLGFDAADLLNDAASRLDVWKKLSDARPAFSPLAEIGGTR